MWLAGVQIGMIFMESKEIQYQTRPLMLIHSDLAISILAIYAQEHSHNCKVPQLQKY